MPFVPAGDCAELHIRGLQATQVWEMTIGAQHTGSYDQSDIDGLAESADIWAGTYLLPLMGAQTFYEQSYVRGLNASIDLEGENHGHAGAGTHTGGSLAAQVAIAVTKLTGHTGRSARGRMFMAGVPAGVLVDDAHVSDAYATLVTTNFTQLLTAIVDANWTPCVISRQHGGVALNPAVVYFITQVVTRDTRLDTQRRRLGKD